MRKYGYLIVEGPHDVEFAYRVLRPFGLTRVRLESNLDPFFAPLVPHTYPPDGDLQKRMATPLFLQCATHSIAIHSAIGDSRLVGTVEENSVLIDFQSLAGVGILFDADSDIGPSARYASVRELLRGNGFQFPDDAGSVSPSQPHLGAFVLPDNANQGTLEHLLLDCAAHVYPTLLGSATAHVEAAIVDGALLEEDKAELLRPAGRNKAIVGSIAAVLRPGKAVQVSIQDNRWLRDTALELQRVKAVQSFLRALLELP